MTLLLGREVREGTRLVGPDAPFIVTRIEPSSSPFGTARVVVDQTGRTMTVLDDHPVITADH